VRYAQRVDDLDRAIKRVAKTQEAAREALEDLHDVIRRTIAKGPRGTQAEVSRRTGYTRERLRQIARQKAPKR
jgi:hypothetical protein